ncbi:hypothetical protein QJS04_geneDACA012536 [Acorus gramineus]|uniref:U6 snRNA phosphodiesterase n=1 Tax=Acorus gramineus TaxID=55184 RepID=A0AAV9B816_ACOGR|nr:hypothetical protein QJS04_geneDACA012536 [Acorus gramineus]
MEALRATYGGCSSSESESDEESPHLDPPRQSERLPPPPLDLLDSLGLTKSVVEGSSRIRSFPHVEGNYALHVFIPVLIPSAVRKDLGLFVKRVSSLVPGIHAVDIDIPLIDLCKDDQKFEQLFFGREFHISLGRTVPIRVHQIDSIVPMLRQKLQSQKRYWIEFTKWEVFVNDDHTRTFLSLEVTGEGLYEITKQIHIVDEIYRLHGLPEFYKNPRPHISLAWALGDNSSSLNQALQLNRHYPTACSVKRQLFVCKFSGIECKVGKKSYKICKLTDQ